MLNLVPSKGVLPGLAQTGKRLMGWLWPRRSPLESDLASQKKADPKEDQLVPAEPLRKPAPASPTTRLVIHDEFNLDPTPRYQLLRERILFASRATTSSTTVRKLVSSRRSCMRPARIDETSSRFVMS